MSGVKGRSGRKKCITNVMKYLEETIDSNWYELVEALVTKAKDGDREALFYCFDRRLGKPKIDIVSDGEQLGAGIVTQLFTLLANKQRELRDKPVITIEEGKDATKQG